MNTIWTLRAVACAALAAATTATAQTPPAVIDPAATQRNVEQGLGNLQQPVLPLVQPQRSAAPAAQAEADIDKLVGVQVQTPSQLPKLARQIEDYWLPFFQKPVRGVQVNEFKSWLWDQLQQQGYLGYIVVTMQDEADGTLVQVAVQAPTIGRATVLTLDELGQSQEEDAYANLVAQRFAKAFPAGTLVDVQGIEAQLNAMAYDLPLSLEASLRQVGAETVDVVVNLRRIAHEPGQVSSVVAQVNNYGLKAYGREQLLGVVRVAGPRPLSEFVGVAQVSKGVGYVRGEYSQPIEGLATRWNVYGTVVRSKANTAQELATFTQRGDSHELGGGLTSLLTVNRAGTWYSVAELSRRQSDSRLTTHSTGQTVTTRKRTDEQVRLGLRSSHVVPYADRLTSETTWTLGRLKLGAQDASFGQADAVYEQGSYQRFEHSGALQKALPADARWTFTSRWRGQAVSQNMDSYNKISLGGVNGIRAFESDEGVGDQGVQVSFDLTRQINPQFYAGVFYDAGRVRTSKKTQSRSYTLQGTGLTFGGTVHPQVDWTLSVAKSHGSTPAQGINGQIGDWRAFFAANWRY